MQGDLPIAKYTSICTRSFVLCIKEIELHTLFVLLNVWIECPFASGLIYWCTCEETDYIERGHVIHR